MSDAKHGLRLAADLDVMWADLPVLDRIDAAGAAGFEGIALSAPYDLPAKDLQRAVLRAGVSLVRIATPPPNYTGGHRGFAATTGGDARFRHDLRRALRYCTVLQVPMLQLLAGPGDATGNRDTLLSNLEHAAEAAPAWMQFVIGPEPFSDGLVSDFADCADLLAEIDTPKLGMLLPCALTPDSLARSRTAVQAFGPRIAALVLETEPEKNAPLTLSGFAGSIAETGLKGWLVASYTSKSNIDDTLAWMSS